jgi:urease accessory protein
LRPNGPDQFQGSKITLSYPTPAVDAAPRQPRAHGTASLAVKRRGEASVLDRLHQKGSLKLLFPRGSGAALTGVLLNTAGGCTGGDRFDCTARVASGCHLVLTTQAAERAYRAQPGEIARINNRITLDSKASAGWLPQETILFDGSALNRRLTVDMATDARALVVEPLILGRAAMAERLHDIAFCDRIDVIRDGAPIYSDRTCLQGDAVAQMAGPATGAGCGAWASVILAARDAERFLAPARALMPPTGGVSLIREGLLVARILAADGFGLRQSLIPLIRCLRPGDLPRTWMI